MKLKNVIAGTACICAGVIIGCVTTITTLSKGLLVLKALEKPKKKTFTEKIKDFFNKK